MSRWWIVLASFLGMMVSQGPVAVYAFGVFLKPVSEELGVSRGSFSLALNLLNIMCAVFIPVLGHLIDRHGIRIIVLPMIALFALTTASLSYLQPSLAVLYGLFALQGVFSAGNVPTGYVKSISAWFDRDRGLALGIAIAGVGLGTALMPQFLSHLMQNYGWRGAYVGLGAAVFVLAFVPVALFIKDPPTDRRAPEVRREAAPGQSLGEALRSARFWAMTVAFFTVIAAANGTVAHMIAMLTDRGVPPETATAALSMVGLAIIAARIVSGYCVDRFHAPYIAVVFFACPIIGIAVLLSDVSGAAAAVGAVLCGLGIGAEVDLMAFFVGRYFGLRAFGSIYGLMFAVFIVGVGMGTYLMGLSFDMFHSYTPVLVFFLGALAVACFLIGRAGPYRYPATAAAPGVTAA